MGPFDTIKKRYKHTVPFIIFIIFSLFFLGLLIDSFINPETLFQKFFWTISLLFSLIITIILYFNKSKDYIYLTGGRKSIELIASKQDKESVETFIENIHSSMRLYYKFKFSQFDRETPYEFKLSQIKWLKEIKAVNESEYNELIAKANTNNIIGFQNFEDLE